MFSRSSRRPGWVGCHPRASRVWARRLVHREDRAERAEILLRHRLDRRAQSPADDCRDVPHRVALVADGVPKRPGRCRLEGQPEQHRCVERMHGRPALGAVARVAGHPGAARCIGQQTGESAFALVVDRARNADSRAAHTARGQTEQRFDRTASTAHRSVGRQRVGLGGGAARHPGRTRDRDDRAVAADELLPQRGKSGALLGDGLRGEAVVATIGDAATFIPSALAATPAEIRAFAAVAIDALGGRIDILINNAALCPPTNTVGLTNADLESTLAVNIRAPHVLVAALAPPMAERGTGAVVTIGSWRASVGSPIVGLYSATKAAEEQLSRSWAAELGHRGVRFNVVSPGVARTPINDTQGDLLDQIAAETPASRTVHPEDVAHAVAWLASDDAALIHTLPVDGGISTTRLG